MKTENGMGKSAQSNASLAGYHNTICFLHVVSETWKVLCDHAFRKHLPCLKMTLVAPCILVVLRALLYGSSMYYCTRSHEFITGVVRAGHPENMGSHRTKQNALIRLSMKNPATLPVVFLCHN